MEFLLLYILGVCVQPCKAPEQFMRPLIGGIHQAKNAVEDRAYRLKICRIDGISDRRFEIRKLCQSPNGFLPSTDKPDISTQLSDNSRVSRTPGDRLIV